MKRLTFKKPFNGMDSALKLIPESYKVDGKEFQITDGTETYNIRWDINEATVLIAENKNLINEDMDKIKHLMGFKSQETLGNLKGEERLNENSSFTDVWNKTKSLLSESKEEVNEMISGSANGLGFTGEGNLEGNAPISEMEKEEEDGEEKLDEFENPDVEKLFNTMGDMNKIQTLASKINTRPEKIEAAVAYVKAIIGDDESLQKKVARVLMNDKGEEQNVSPELAQQAADANMNESINEYDDGSDEAWSEYYKILVGKDAYEEGLFLSHHNTPQEIISGILNRAYGIGKKGGEWFKPGIVSSIIVHALSGNRLHHEETDDGNMNEEPDKFDEIFEDMYQEELSPAQEKHIDKDGDGKITKKDFDILNKEK